jgi:hypothetical protein
MEIKKMRVTPCDLAPFPTGRGSKQKKPSLGERVQVDDKEGKNVVFPSSWLAAENQ